MNGERYQQIWSQISRYELIGEIGRGGMGVVYRAYEAALNRTVALKVLAPELASQPGFVERLRHEALSAARLRHPHIALLYEFGQDDGTPFLAMEYVPGASVRQLLESGPLPLERTLTIVEQIGQALDYAHCMGIVHRDVKPSNILIGADDAAMLIDFGLAEIAESSILTCDGAILGTPHYMAPEQASGQRTDARSDQYALAVVAYEMLTGLPPFHGRGATAVVHAQIYELPPPPTEQCPSLPASINAVFLRALAKLPHERYPSLAEFVAALRNALATNISPPTDRSRLRLIIASLGGFAIMVLALLAVFFSRAVSTNGTIHLNVQAATRSESPLPRQIIWAYTAEPKLIGGPAPVASDGMLIIGTLDGQVIGLQAVNGEVRWRSTDASTLFGAPSAGNGLVFVGSSDGYLQGLSVSTGKTTWKTKLVGVAQAAPILSGDRLIVTTNKGYVYLLQAASGQVIWDRPLTQNVQSASMAYGRIYICADATLYALDARNGAVDWTFNAASPLRTTPVVSGNMVVVGSERGMLYALNVANGSVSMRYQASGALSATPVAHADMLYSVDQAGMVTALNVITAKVVWQMQTGATIVAAPLLAGDRLLIGATNGILYALDAQSGQQLTQIQLAGGISATPALSGGLVYVRADRIYALGE